MVYTYLIIKRQKWECGQKSSTTVFRPFFTERWQKDLQAGHFEMRYRPNIWGTDRTFQIVYWRAGGDYRVEISLVIHCIVRRGCLSLFRLFLHIWSDFRIKWIDNLYLYVFSKCLTFFAFCLLISTKNAVILEISIFLWYLDSSLLFL